MSDRMRKEHIQCRNGFKHSSTMPLSSWRLSIERYQNLSVLQVCHPCNGTNRKIFDGGKLVTLQMTSQEEVLNPQDFLHHLQKAAITLR